MKKSEMDPSSADGFHNWIKDEWERSMGIKASIENHAYTYLLTANGGGAATVMAFAGSAHYQNGRVFLSLAFFIAGLVCCGLSIAAAFEAMTRITKGISEDWRRFHSNEVGTREFDQRHKERFSRPQYGKWLGYAAFALFAAGVVMSTYTFFYYIDTEEGKSAKSEQTDASVTRALVAIEPVASQPITIYIGVPQPGGKQPSTAPVILKK